MKTKITNKNPIFRFRHDSLKSKLNDRNPLIDENRDHPVTPNRDHLVTVIGIISVAGLVRFVIKSYTRN